MIIESTRGTNPKSKVKPNQETKGACSGELEEKHHSRLYQACSMGLDRVNVASHAVEERPLLGKALSLAGVAARSGRSIPDFIYPTIYDATAAERAQILGILDSLPLHHATNPKSISMVDELVSRRPGWVTNGRAKDLSFSNRIRLSRTQLTNPDKFAATTIHEIGHTTHYETRVLGKVGDISSSEPFGEAPFITDYAMTNAKEDFAESFEEFYLRAENLKEKAPEKYEFMKELNKPSFLESLVDREEFRETGKFIADKFGDKEIYRHGAQALFFGTSVFQAVHGLSQWVRSSKNNDAMQHVGGILNTATGVAFLAGFNPLLGMAFQGANSALQSAVKRGKLHPKEVESTIAAPFRPVEALLGREKAPIEESHRPGKVLAVAAGGAAGGTLGSVVGPYLGVMGGYHLAGGLGGAIGLVAGGMLGFWAGSSLGGRLAEKLARA